MYQLFFFFFPFFFFFLFKILTYKVFLFRYPMDGWWVVACISPKNWSNSLHLWLNFESVKIWDPEMLLARCFSTFSQLWNTPLTRSAIEREREFLLFPCILLSTGKWIGVMLRRASQDRKHTSKTGSTRFFNQSWFSSSHFPSVDSHKEALHIYIDANQSCTANWNDDHLKRAKEK